MLKSRRYSKIITENGLKIQAISNKQTGFHTDRVLLFGQVTEKKEKAHPSHFLKFLLASRTNGTLAFAPTAQADPTAKAKEPVFFNAFFGSSKLIIIFVNLFR